MAISYNDYKKEWKNGIGKEINRINSGNLTAEEKRQRAIQTSMPFSVSPKINLQEKKKELEEAREASVKARAEALQSELNKRGYKSLNPIVPYDPSVKLSRQSVEENKKRLNVQKEIAPIFAAVNENAKETANRLNKATNDLRLAQYQYDVDRVNNEETNLWDKTGGNITRALADIGSIFTAGSNKYIDENGNELYLPSYNKLKQEKVRQDYDTGVGRFLGDVAYNSTKILASTGMNIVAPGSGTALYWSDMFADNLEYARAQGYDGTNAIAYSALGTGMEYLTGKFLGSATKGLTGGQASTLEQGLGKAFNKVIKNENITKFLASAGSEATEEFLQEYLDNLNRLIVLDEKNPIDALGSTLFNPDVLSDALYSAAVGAASGGALSFANGNTTNQNVSEVFKEQLEETKKNSNDKNQIAKIDKVIGLIDNQNKTTTIQDLAQQKQNNTNNIKLPQKKVIGSNQINENSLVNYSEHEIENFKDGKVKVVQSDNDIISFINSAKKVPSNAKLYFGKIGKNIASKINKKLGINVENYNISLKADSIKHILTHHSSKNETLRGQVPIVEADFSLIPKIVSNYDNVEQTGITGNGKPALTFEKQIGDIYYLVNYVSDKRHNLEVQTMYKKKKKNSSTASNANILRLTSETDSGTSSFLDSNNNINSTNSQIAPLPSQYNMQQTEQNDTFKNKVMNPNEISKLTKEDANTTPLLPIVKRETGDGRSKFRDNVTKKTKMLDENSRTLLSMEEDIEYYQEVTNKESLDKAFSKLEKGGMNETLSWFSKDSKDATSVDVAEGWILLKQYADSGNYDGMVEVAKKMREIGTKAGQTVQAFNIMERMTPEGMVKYAQSELSEAYDKLVKNKTKEWIDKHKSDFDLTPDEVAFIMDTMQEVSQMEDGYDKRVKLAEIQKVMTDKLPPERGAGIKAWMRVSMLFNPKTQVRNVAGNAIIAPVNYFSDLFASGVDKIISKSTGVRTTGRTSIKNYAKGFKRGLFQSYNDFKKGINTRNLDGNRFEISQGRSFDNNKTVGKALNKVDNLLSFMLDAGDRGFYEASFTNSINNQMVLNNTTTVTQEMIDIATQESLSRTWQDNNNYTKFVLQTRNALNKINVKGYGLGDLLIPFAKTPANLTKAIIDYSPAGLVNTLFEGNNLRKSLSNGQYTPQMQHKFVQNLGKATAGTMLYVLGYALAKTGITSGESDDDKDVKNFLQNTLGVSSYSIKIGDKSFTYDWAQPVAAPLSIMANIVNSNKNKETALLEAVISSLDSAGSILLEQSFLQSINDVLNNNDGVVSGLVTEVLELPARAIPTLSKQIADMIDGTQRQTFEYGKPVESAINYAKSKIPFVSKTLAPSKDTLGRKIQKYGGKNNIFNVFLNPANVNTENISKSAAEIYRLYKKTGETDIMPRVAPYYINQNGEKIVLDSKQRAEYQQVSGEIIEDSIKDLLNSKEYKNLSDEEKADVVNNIVNYSYNKAREEVLDIPMSNQYNKINSYVNDNGKVSNYYLNKEEIDYSYNNPEKYALITQITTYVKYQEYSQELEMIRSNAKDKKSATIKYVNSLPLSIPKKAMMIKSYYSSYDSYNNQIVQYINSQNITKADKETILKKLGFTIKNGKVYY